MFGKKKLPVLCPKCGGLMSSPLYCKGHGAGGPDHVVNCSADAKEKT